jgi:hypothetical protein
MRTRYWRRYDLRFLMTSVTVRFSPSSTSQSELLRELVRWTRSLEKDGVLENAKVEAVFPGDETEHFKGAFVVSFHSSTPRQVADRLNELPGVRKAYVAPGRGELRVR